MPALRNKVRAAALHEAGHALAADGVFHGPGPGDGPRLRLGRADRRRRRPSVRSRRGPLRRVAVRNPQYLGVLLVVAGEALLTGRMVLLGYALLLAVAYQAFVIWHEEPELGRLFGGSY